MKLAQFFRFQRAKNKFRSGRPRKTFKRDDSRIITISKANHFKTAPDIRAEINQSLNAPISLSTRKRWLREKVLIGRIAVKKPLLRPANRFKKAKFR